MLKNECKVGDTVFFGRANGEKTEGVIVKLNAKKAKVRTTEGRGRAHAVGSEWGVPYPMLTPSDGGRPARVTRTLERAPSAVTLSESEIINELRGIESGLSPENLHCDGEISVAAARRKERSLLARQRKLVAALGREPTTTELWGR